MKIYHRLIIIMLAIFAILTISVMTVYGYGSSSDSSYSSGGSGGRSMSSEDSYGNIFKYEIRNQNIVFNQFVKYSFVTPEFSIYEILINGKNNELDITTRVDDLINTSKYANKSSPGIVYRNENVWIGTDRINYITVRFRVNNSWMNSNGLNDSLYPRLLKWNGETWLVLKTDIINKDDTYTYFEAPKAGSSSTSIFAISAPFETIYTDKIVTNSTDKIVTNDTDINGATIHEERLDTPINGEVYPKVTAITIGASRGVQAFEIILLLSICAVVGYILKRT